MEELYRIIFEYKDRHIILRNTDLIFSEPEPCETCWMCPKSRGVGRFHKIIIRPGLEIWLLDYTFNQDTIFKHRNIPPLLKLNFTLSGHYQLHHDNSTTVAEYEGEHQIIHYFNDSSSVCRVMAEVPAQCISILVYPEFFLSYMESDISELSSVIEFFLKSNKGCGFKHINTTRSDISYITRLIFKCKLKGISRKLFLESKALELLFLQLVQMSGQEQCCNCTRKIHPQDKKQTEQARNHLVSNIESPPCLCDLARTAGMSHPKLNRCFKQMYGMTVFQYLRHERLNRAKVMLENEGITVTETAYQVGYDSLSHFSQAYKKQFGTSPSSCLKVA